MSSAQLIMVPEDREFTFKSLCPYCKGNLRYHVEGWEQDDNGLWMAESLGMECSTMPDITSKKWEEWFKSHSEMPYVHQMPIDEKVKNWINERYRFELK